MLKPQTSFCQFAVKAGIVRFFEQPRSNRSVNLHGGVDDLTRNFVNHHGAAIPHPCCDPSILSKNVADWPEKYDPSLCVLCVLCGTA
jgi:hypothetical protein